MKTNYKLHKYKTKSEKEHSLSKLILYQKKIIFYGGDGPNRLEDPLFPIESSVPIDGKKFTDGWFSSKVYDSQAVEIVKLYKATNNFTGNLRGNEEYDKFYKQQISQYDQFVSESCEYIEKLPKEVIVSERDYDFPGKLKEKLTELYNAGTLCPPHFVCAYFLIFALQYLFCMSDKDINFKEINKVNFQVSGIEKRFYAILAFLGEIIGESGNIGVHYLNVDIDKCFTKFNELIPNMYPFISPKGELTYNAFLYLLFHQIIPIGCSKKDVGHTSHQGYIKNRLEMLIHDLFHTTAVNMKYIIENFNERQIEIDNYLDYMYFLYYTIIHDQELRKDPMIIRLRAFVFLIFFMTHEFPIAHSLCPINDTTIVYYADAEFLDAMIHIEYFNLPNEDTNKAKSIKLIHSLIKIVHNTNNDDSLNRDDIVNIDLLITLILNRYGKQYGELYDKVMKFKLYANGFLLYRYTKEEAKEFKEKMKTIINHLAILPMQILCDDFCIYFKSKNIELDVNRYMPYFSWS